MRKYVLFLLVCLAALLLLSATVSRKTLADSTAEATMEGTVVLTCPELAGTPSAAETAEPTMAVPADSSTAEAGQEAEEIARPSNPGGPGPALWLKGDPKAGAQIFVDNCQKCHGEEGVGNIANPGSDDETIPPLNPIDSTLLDQNPLVYACNIDLFLEHGSVPEGPSPQETMPAWGDEHKLTDQQLADVGAYVMSLNPVEGTPTPEPTDSGK